MCALPDVLGFQLDDALSLLKSAGVSVYVQETHAPYAKEKTGECRIIRQIHKKDCVELIVSYF